MRRTLLTGFVAVVVAAGLAYRATKSVPVYLGRDAGEYLARSHNVFGVEAGEAAYLPAFPLLLRVARVAFDDLTSVRVAIVGLVALIAVALCYAIGRRLSSPAAVGIGATAGALSPLVAEALGWYGAGTLLSLALLATLLRPLDDLYRRWAVKPLIVSGLVLALLALTHPFWLVVAVQVAVVAWLIFVLGARLRPQTFPPMTSGSAALAIAVVAGAGSVGVLAAKAFYSTVQYSTTVQPSTGSLSLLPDFAFRDAPLVALLVGGTALIAVPIGRHVAGVEGVRLGVWTLALASVVIIDLVLLSDNPEYTTRILYALALVGGLTFALLIALAARTARVPAVVIVVALFGTSLLAFDSRSDVAVPFYNRLSDDELHALHFLRNDVGSSVLVATTDLDEHRYFGSVIAGLVRRPAPLPLPAAGVAQELQLGRAVDIGRLLAGDDVLTLGPVELALQPELGDGARLGMVVERARADVVIIEGVDATRTVERAELGSDGVVAHLSTVTPAALRVLAPFESFDWRLDVVAPDRARLVVRNGNGVEVTDLNLKGAQFAGTGPSRVTRVRVLINGPDPVMRITRRLDAGVGVARLTSAEILGRRGIGHVLTLKRWDGFERFSRHRCLDPVYANPEATVLAYVPDCRR